MKFDRVAIGLHCHSLDDFPTHETGADADSLLTCWTVLWHPALIAHTKRMPSWVRIGDPPPPVAVAADRADDADSNGHGNAAADGDSEHGQAVGATTREPRILIVLPSRYAEDPEQAWIQQIEQPGGRIQRHVDRRGRNELLADLLDPLQSNDLHVDDELVKDFYALGYAYLQIDLLTRQMHYAAQMSETSFEETLVMAAESALAGDFDAASTRLQTCFDFLSQERDHYYAVDVYLLDIALVAESLVESSLCDHLDDVTGTNLLIEGRVLETMQSKSIDVYTKLCQSIEADRVGVIGGEYRELPLSLLSLDTVNHQLQRGGETFERVLERRPSVFGRRTFGLTSALPQLLLKYGFEGALHATFDGGQFPEASQSKSRWEGNGQYSLDAILRAPKDATQAETFLSFARRLGSSIDTDHIATHCFVHWIGQTSTWYEALKRAARYTQALGRFVTVDDYFRDAYDPGLHDRFSADQYHSTTLADRVSAVSADFTAAEEDGPISMWERYWRNYLACVNAVNSCTLRLMVENSSASRDSYHQAEHRLNEFQSDPFAVGHRDLALDAQADCMTAARAMANALATSTPPAAPTVNASDGSSAIATGLSAKTAELGYVLLNPFSFPRRVLIDESRVRPASEKPVYVVKGVDERGASRVIVDIPSLGMVALRDAHQPPALTRRARRKKTPPIAEGRLLRNEFLEAELDDKTGGIRSLRTYGSRTNRLSHVLTARLTPGEGVEQATKMVADEIRVVDADTLLGRICVRGRLINGRERLVANFEQSYQLTRGSRVLHVETTFDAIAVEELGNSVWTNYIAARFAWPNEAADLSRSLNDVRLPTSAKRIEAPLFLQIDDGVEQTAILCGGRPYHLRSGRRTLDSLFIVKGEPQRTFRWGLAVDLKQPFRESLALLTQPTVVTCDHALPIHPSAWLFHVDARNVLATQWLPIWNDDQIAGLRIRFLETDGKTAKVTVRSIRHFKSARKVDGLAKTNDTCELSDDRLTFTVKPFEQADIEAMFS